MLFQAASIMPVQEADAASVCTIDTNKTYQIIKGFGGINLREWTGSDLTSAQVQKAFGNGDDELGLSILRIYVNDNSSQWNLAVSVAKQAQALGATVFASPWNPPESMRVSGGSNGKYMVDKSKYADYAKHLNDFVKYMEGQGVDLYSVSVQNEPDYAHDWTYWSASDCASFIADYGKAVTAGTNAKLMSPESFQYRKDIYNAILNNSKAFENCDLFGTHFYGTQRSQMDFPALENCGKDIWMTEVYVPDSTSDADTYPQAVQVAENIHNGLTVGNMNAYVWWYIRRSYSPMKENGNISKRGYCMAQYSKWVRPGDVRIEATEQPDSNILVSAYKHSPTQIQIVAVNKGAVMFHSSFPLMEELLPVLTATEHLQPKILHQQRIWIMILQHSGHSCRQTAFQHLLSHCRATELKFRKIRISQLQTNRMKTDIISMIHLREIQITGQAEEALRYRQAAEFPMPAQRHFSYRTVKKHGTVLRKH